MEHLVTYCNYVTMEHDVSIDRWKQADPNLLNALMLKVFQKKLLSSGFSQVCTVPVASC